MMGCGCFLGVITEERFNCFFALLGPLGVADVISSSVSSSLLYLSFGAAAHPPAAAAADAAFFAFCHHYLYPSKERAPQQPHRLLGNYAAYGRAVCSANFGEE